MPKYAADTDVSVQRSRAEIERLLERYGATGFGYMSQGRRVLLAFEADERHIRFELTLPSPDEQVFWDDKRYVWKRVSSATAEKRYQREVRRLWRVLHLGIKAKLELVESGVTTFEEEFLAHIVLADNRTMGDWALPQIEESYATGRMPGLLPRPDGPMALGPGQ